MDPDTPFSFLITKAFTLREVAEVLGISLTQVVGHVADGTMVAIDVGRGNVRRDLRVTDKSLDAFVDDRAVAPTAPAPRPRRLLRRAATAPQLAEDGYVARKAARLAARKERKK